MTLTLITLLAVFIALFIASSCKQVKLSEDLSTRIAKLKDAQELAFNTKCELGSVKWELQVSKDKIEEANRYAYDLKKKLAEAHQRLADRQALNGVKFTANVPHLGWTKTEFKLGLGPCGKEVTAIQLVEKDDRYVLTQWCSDGERKEFEYKKEDVSGRIERSYKAYAKR